MVGERQCVMELDTCQHEEKLQNKAAYFLWWSNNKSFQQPRAFSFKWQIWLNWDSTIYYGLFGSSKYDRGSYALFLVISI